jgi:hypothetical protein
LGNKGGSYFKRQVFWRPGMVDNDRPLIPSICLNWDDCPFTILMKNMAYALRALLSVDYLPTTLTNRRVDNFCAPFTANDLIGAIIPHAILTSYINRPALKRGITGFVNFPLRDDSDIMPQQFH